MKKLLRFAALGIAPVVLAGAVAGCAPNAREATATVMTIDRNCKIVTTEYDANYKPIKKDVRTDSCNSIDEWDKVKVKRNKVVDGTAVVHLSYTAPQTGQPETGELKFDGRDDEFYQLKAGDEIKILVSDADPVKIAKA
jgi:hypothetical protein